MSAATPTRNGLGPLELGRLLQYGLATASAGGALIHLAAARDHSSQAVEAGLFIGAAVGQLVWAGLIVRSISQWLLGAGAVLSVVLIACWALSRTTGLPLLGGEVEPLGFKDGIAVLLEAAVIAGAGLLALIPAPGRALTVPAGRLASRTTAVSVAALTVTAVVFAPAHPGGGHGATELASGHHGEAGQREEALGGHGEGDHGAGAGAQDSADAPHDAMGAHDSSVGHVAGADGHGETAGHEDGHGATKLAHAGAHGNHGDSAARLAAAGSAGDRHAAHSSGGAESESAATDHSSHGPANHGSHAPEGDHSGHGATEPNKGGDGPGDGGTRNGDDERERKDIVGSLIGFVDDLQRTRRPVDSPPGVPTEPAPTNR